MALRSFAVAAVLWLAPFGLIAHAQDATYQEPPSAAGAAQLAMPSGAAGGGMMANGMAGNRMAAGHARSLVQLLRGIRLTPAQRGQIRGIMTDFRPRFMQAMRAARDAHRQYEAALFGGAPDSHLMKLVQTESDQHDQAARLRAGLELKIRAILTPDQLAQLKQAQAQAQPNPN